MNSFGKQGGNLRRVSYKCKRRFSLPWPEPVSAQQRSRWHETICMQPKTDGKLVCAQCAREVVREQLRKD